MSTPVALSVDVPVGTVTGTRLDGVELALWRDPAGAVHVWQDLCPHRGMRLSLGFLRDGKLACPYHGWRFEPSGRCVHIPAHPRAVPPASVSVRRYPAFEALGFIWTGGALAVSATSVTPVRSVTIRRDVSAVRGGLVARGFVAVPDGTYTRGAARVGVHIVDDRTTALHLVHLGAAPADVLTGLATEAASLRAELDAA